jgi:hypothetical protein
MGTEYLAQFDEGDVLRFLKDPKTSSEVRNLAFAYFTPEEFPTHRMLQELMMLDPVGSERDQIIEIATLILPWCRDGNYGCLFDGTSNLSLTGKIAHFELGYIPESAKELKAAAGFLITNHARKHIITLPRALRKRNVYEEVARFLSTSPAARKSSRNPTPSFASSIAGTFPSSSNTRGSSSRASAPPYSATAASFSSCARTTGRIWRTWRRTSRCPKSPSTRS